MTSTEIDVPGAGDAMRSAGVHLAVATQSAAEALEMAAEACGVDRACSDADALAALDHLRLALAQLRMVAPLVARSSSRLGRGRYRAWCGHEYRRGELPTCEC